MALWQDILQNLINVLPDVYNKEVKDLNYYRYLEVLAKELAAVQQEITTSDKNGFLEEATGEALYNNFGVLVNLPRKSNWTDEQYRGILKGVMNALLKGPSPQTIKESIKLFTTFDSEVYELYKDYDKIDPSYVKGASIPYSFIVKINKDIDISTDASELTENLVYFINLIKPAHTIGIVVVDLVGTESYRESWVKTYHKDIFDDPSSSYYQQVDKIFEDYLSSSKVSVDHRPTESKFGYKHFDYPLTFFLNDYGTQDDPNSGSKIFGEESSIKLIGPIFVMLDNSIGTFESVNSETRNTASNLNLAFKLNGGMLNSSPLADAQISEYYEIKPELIEFMPVPDEVRNVQLYTSPASDSYDTSSIIDPHSPHLLSSQTENIQQPTENSTSDTVRAISESTFVKPADITSTVGYVLAELPLDSPQEYDLIFANLLQTEVIFTQPVDFKQALTFSSTKSETFGTPIEQPTTVIDFPSLFESAFPTTLDSAESQLEGSGYLENKPLQSNEITTAFAFNSTVTFNSGQFLYVPIINIADGRMYRVDGQGIETEILAKSM